MITAMFKVDKNTNKKVHHTNLMSEIVSNENLDLSHLRV